jgi:predicted MPP superfamily phosphohydrolase
MWTVTPSRTSTRARWWLLSGVLFLLLSVWSVLIEPRWVARRDLALNVEGWQGPAGLKVAVAADWHVTKLALWRVMTVERARRMVDEINAAQPDVVLLPGDFIAEPNYRPDTAATAQDEIAQVLGGLKAPFGVHAVLGNHDWDVDGPRMAAALRSQGIQVLENESVPLGGTPLWLVGIGDYYTGRSQPARAVAGVPRGAHALVLMHDPASLLGMPRLGGLAVAGHTHGGQVYLPFIGAPVTATVAPREWNHGWVRHEGNVMYVTSGLGVSIFPVRFNMRPEWALITIHQGGTR